MNKLRTYYVPVKLKMTNTLVVKATSQLEAVEIVKESIARNEEALKTNYDEIKIDSMKITCDQDEQILDSINKDFSNFISIDSDGTQTFSINIKKEKQDA